MIAHLFDQRELHLLCFQPHKICPPAEKHTSNSADQQWIQARDLAAPKKGQSRWRTFCEGEREQGRENGSVTREGERNLRG